MKHKKNYKTNLLFIYKIIHKIYNTSALYKNTFKYHISFITNHSYYLKFSFVILYLQTGHVELSLNQSLMQSE